MNSATEEELIERKEKEKKRSIDFLESIYSSCIFEREKSRTRDSPFHFARKEIFLLLESKW